MNLLFLVIVVEAFTNPAQCPTANVPAYCPGSTKTSMTGTLVADPVELNNGAYFRTDSDLVLQTTLGPIEFRRSFTTNPAVWDPQAGYPNLVGIPKLHGGEGGDSTQYWWNNWFTYVEPDTVGTLYLREQGGRNVTFLTADASPEGWLRGGLVGCGSKADQAALSTGLTRGAKAT